MTMKARFDTDYMAGCHPEVLKALVSTNMEQTPGYGLDEYSREAERLILDRCGLSPEKSQVFFLIGGTSANSIVIDACLKKGQGVLCCRTAHIDAHEAGAIEFSGHKVIPISGFENRIIIGFVEEYLNDFYADETWEHMVIPGMVYISFPTEMGTLYSLEELEKLSEICHRHHLLLYVDGARLFYGLTSPWCNVTLEDIARLSDVFYIGGTKEGCLMGEAVVLKDKSLFPHFFSLVKMHGGLLAKGRLLGVQFKTLFTNNLIERITSQAVEFALEIKEAFVNAGYYLYADSFTNQQFFDLPNDVIDRLSQEVGFEHWGPKVSLSSPVRFVTSWATTRQEVDFLKSLL